MSEKAYVLGTHDEEINRLGFQHRVWHDRAMQTWQKAGFAAGQKLLDAGCGPGYVTLDLSRIVGQSGEVLAVDRSRRFLDFLEKTIATNGITNIKTVEADVQQMQLANNYFDGAWSRWVLSFTPEPEKVLKTVAASLKSGAVFALHEYIGYRDWRMLPPSPLIDGFTDAVIKSWHDQSGEPDVALAVLPMLKQLGFTIKHAEVMAFITTPASPYWQWAEVFFFNYLPSLVERGYIQPQTAEKMQAEWKSRAASNISFMHTPSVLEIVAVKN